MSKKILIIGSGIAGISTSLKLKSFGLESTIINLLGKPTILRFGGLDVSKIEKILKKKVLIKTNSKKKVSPGQFPLHYYPGIQLRTNAKK